MRSRAKIRPRARTTVRSSRRSLKKLCRCTMTLTQRSKSFPLPEHSSPTYPHETDPTDIASPPPHTHSYASAAAQLAIDSDLKVVRLTDADDVLFGVYQDWVHQNSGTHLDGVINEDVKWQYRWKKLFFKPTLLCNVWPVREKFCLGSCGRSQRHKVSEMERGAGNRFSDGNFATFPPHNWRQKTFVC